jgi:hypothetical protein
MAKFSRKLAWERAQGFCEYCRLSQRFSILPHEIDHIRAKKHRGRTTMENTCVACAHCNGSKGSNVAGYDIQTEQLVRLFNPRTDRWKHHFFWHGPELVGKTPIGRATIDVLRINHSDCVIERKSLIDAELFPPGVDR